MSQIQVPQLLTVRQAAALLAVSRFTVYRLVARRAVVAYWIGSACRISAESVAAYLQAHGTAPAARAPAGAGSAPPTGPRPRGKAERPGYRFLGR